MKYKILIFESIHKVLKAEKILLKNNIKHEIVPTPKEITSDCGMSIRINPEIVNLQDITTMLLNNKFEFKVSDKEIV